MGLNIIEKFLSQRFYASTRALPFKLGNERRIAVKAIDHRGNEVIVVREIES